MKAPAKKKPSSKPSPKLSDVKPVMGRPEKYTEEWLEQEAIALREWIQGPRNLWLKGFAYERGYTPPRFAEFAQKSPHFSEALHFAKDEQERKFIHGAWSKEMGMDFVRHFMPRMLKDRPEWKQAWDREEEKADSPTTVIINKIEK